MPRVKRFDFTTTIEGTFKTDEGFMWVTAPVSRTGVFLYMNSDGSLRRELRHPDDVFKRDSLDTLKLKPVTDDHPSELVTPENDSRLSVGSVGESVYADGPRMMATFIVRDKAMIQSIEDGKRELSLGYSVVLEEESGEFEGEAYDFRQTEVRYNHLAIVDEARAGAVASIKLDSGDAFLCTDGAAPSNSPNQPTGGDPMSRLVKVNLDGIEYEAEPEVAKALAAATKRADEAETKAKDAEEEAKKADEEMQKEKGRADQLDADLKKASSPEAIAARVDARASLVATATRVIADFNADGMDEDAIKRAVILAVNSDTAEDLGKRLDAADSAYLSARFDAVVEALPSADDAALAASAAIAAGTRADAGNQGKDQPDAAKARADHASSLTDAWKSEE